MPRQLSATHVLIAVNAAVFLIAGALLAPGNAAAQALPLYLPDNPAFAPWQFVTHMFMHGGFSHLLMNMFGLFMFGSVLERIWGARRFLLFYFAAGIGAGLIYTAVTHFEHDAARASLEERGVPGEVLDRIGDFEQPEGYYRFALERAPRVSRPEVSGDFFDYIRDFHIPVVGASGAIYGVLTAFGMLFPNAKLALIFLPVPVAAKYFIPALLLLDLFSGVTGFSIFGGGIAHFAHLGGALIGLLLMWMWGSPKAPGPGNGAGFQRF